jgi:hypothetical protein
MNTFVKSKKDVTNKTATLDEDENNWFYNNFKN